MRYNKKMEQILLPHGNELKKLRKLQDIFCKEFSLAPIFPIFIDEIFLKNNDEKIFLLFADGIFEKGGIFFANVIAKIKSQEKIIEKTAKIVFGEQLFEEEARNQKICQIEPIFFPVVQKAKIRFSLSNCVKEWLIFGENWLKIGL